MLVLSRKEGGEIVIGDNIIIKILKTTDSQVKLGIVAPKDVNILRKEILERECLNNSKDE